MNFAVIRMCTQEECLLSDPQGESDADADIEDTDCRSALPPCSHPPVFVSRRPRLTGWFRPPRLQEPGSLQRISSRRRKRPRISRQDTTESEDDGGRSHKSHRWNLRLSPDRTRSRTILEVDFSFLRGEVWTTLAQLWTPLSSPPRRAYRRSGRWSSVSRTRRSAIIQPRRRGAPDF